MASRIHLPIWPTTLDCLSWSTDNWLAVAGGDQVAILTPRLGEPGPNGTHWDSNVFKANAFTADEVPLSQPLSFENFSAGEELSLRHVHALQWSSPGLSGYGQCALAVLSSNHVLSIWEADGKPGSRANWKRKAIVNHAIRKYYDGLQEDGDRTLEELRQRRQVQQRVRAFAWNPNIRCNDVDDEFAPYVDGTNQYLAVSTEGEDILILHVQSPYDILRPHNTEWKLEVVCSFSTRFIVLAHTGPSSEESNGLYRKHETSIANRLAWEAWRQYAGTAQHTELAFNVNGRLFTVTVVTDHKVPKATVTKNFETADITPCRAQMHGPLRFVAGTSYLVAFGMNTVYCTDIALPGTDTKAWPCHHLDDRWDEISGVAVSRRGHGAFHIDVTSHLASATATTTTISLPLDDSQTSTPPAWQHAINDSKAIFSAQHSLDGNVIERVWGIASSPLGDLLATATTMLPSDSVAYVIPSDYRTTVNITHEAKIRDDGTLPFHGRRGDLLNAPSDVLLFSLQRYVEILPDPLSLDALRVTILSTFDFPTVYTSYQNKVTLLPNRVESADIARHLKTRVFMCPEIVKERLILLAAIATDGLSTADRIMQPVVERLVSEVLQLPEELHQGGEMSRRIYCVYNIVKGRLNVDVQADDTEGFDNTWNEECRICNGHVPFESVKWAKCANGHQFSRCALTFLAIQEPGISKHCSICGTQYLNGWNLPDLKAPSTQGDFEMTDELSDTEALQSPQQAQAMDRDDAGWVLLTGKPIEPTENASSLARILFAAFGSCIYCGGRFVA